MVSKVATPPKTHPTSGIRRKWALPLCLSLTLFAVKHVAAAPPGCAGDCDASYRTTVDELVRLVNIALSGSGLDRCPVADADNDQRITVEELVAAVRASLAGCTSPPPSVDTTTLCFLGSTDSPPSIQTIHIQRASGEWTAEPSATWLQVAPSRGQGPTALHVSVDLSTLTDGLYSSAIRIADDGGEAAMVGVELSLSRNGMAQGWQLQTLEAVTSPGQVAEPNGSPAQKTSLALRHDDRPGIAFYRNDVVVDRQLRYTEWNGCTWQAENIERFGIDPSLAYDSSGTPHVSYVQLNSATLRYAHRSAGTWNLETVEAQTPRGATGYRSAIAIDADAQPHIAFLLKFLPDNVFTYDLRYAHRSGDGWIIDTADAQGTTGWDTSLALSDSGEPRISYHTDLPDAVRYAEKVGDTWITESIAAGGKPSSLALDAIGRPRVAFHGLPGSSVNFAYRDEDSWIVEHIDRQGVAPHGGNRPFVSLALDASDTPHVAYVDFTMGALKYASRTGPDAWGIQVIDQGANIGDFCSLVIDKSGNAHISYLDLAVGVLKYAHGPARP